MGGASSGSRNRKSEPSGKSWSKSRKSGVVVVIKVILMHFKMRHEFVSHAGDDRPELGFATDGSEFAERFCLREIGTCFFEE